MAALHDALKSLGPISYAETPLDDLQPFLGKIFNHGQVIVDSVPIPAPAGEISTAAYDGRSRASSSASRASEISVSSARSEPPAADVEVLQKEWKQVKLAPKENPLGMSVYKLSGKDGRGAWFARRSVHEGLGFAKWKKALESEFPETLKVQGGPGEGNIRGIGGEKRVAYENVEGCGKMEVYLLSAQFPGPTTPRDFVTMFITSDQALSNTSGGEEEIPRHFMVVSRPCNHPDTPPRDGYIRGQYESVEFIREVPNKKLRKKSASTTNLPAQNSSRSRSTSNLSKDVLVREARKHSPAEGEGKSQSPDKVEEKVKEGGRARGKTISFDMSRRSDAASESIDAPEEDDEAETNPVEWIMITRSDPGGSVPRFMVERGTPGGIVADASKFLDWACAKDMDDFESESEAAEGGQTTSGDTSAEEKSQKHQPKLHNYQTNGHLAGIEESETSKEEELPRSSEEVKQETNGGLYGMAVGAAGAAAGFFAAHAPQIVQNQFNNESARKSEGEVLNEKPRRDSSSSISSVSSIGSFASAQENNDEDENIDAASGKTTGSAAAQNKTLTAQDKELQKLEEKKKKLDDKINKAREREESKKAEDTAKEEEALRKATEKHEREIKKQEEKHRKEVERLEKKKLKEEQKAEEKRRKMLDRDEKTRLAREVEGLRAELDVVRKEKEILRQQVGDLQAENTALAAKLGRLGLMGEEGLREVRAEVGRTGRVRASSLKALAVRPVSVTSNSGRSSMSLNEVDGGSKMAVTTPVSAGGVENVKT